MIVEQLLILLALTGGVILLYFAIRWLDEWFDQ